VADAALHVTAMGAMVASMVVPVTWAPALLAVLWGAQAVAAVLLRRGWRVNGSFVDLVAVSASVAAPFVAHEHGAVGMSVVALGCVVAGWLIVRLRVGIRGAAERVGAVAMGSSMVVMLAVHVA
jgi:multidrug efflux pump subunit AcrB